MFADFLANIVRQEPGNQVNKCSCPPISCVLVFLDQVIQPSAEWAFQPAAQSPERPLEAAGYTQTSRTNGVASTLSTVGSGQFCICDVCIEAH